MRPATADVDVRPAQVVRRASEYLDRHGVESPVPTAERLLSHVLGTDRAGIYARQGLTSQEAKLFGRALCRRCAGEPLQHVTGEQGFRRIVLRIRPGVFVPRPETEILVQAALDELVDVPAPVVADVGTGSGAIALSIKDERPDATVLATDVSGEAVALARENAEALGLPVTTVEGDLLEPLPPELRGRLDGVIANPPYVSLEARDGLPADVLAEPPLAVFGGIEGYERLFGRSIAWLRPGGLVAVEIEESTAAAVVGAAREAGFVGVAVRPDLAGRDRVVTARRPPGP
jgi:release factor glutamine methyltransferase